MIDLPIIAVIIIRSLSAVLHQDLAEYERGTESGSELDDWLQAEEEIRSAQ